MEPDSLIDQIREVRHRISERCGHDPRRLVEYYAKLDKEEYAHRLIKPPEHERNTEEDQTEAPPQAQCMPSPIHYVRYYHLEQYLFNTVRRRFHLEHSIGAFDFFSIVIWKANRAKSKVAQRLLATKALGEDHNLEVVVRRLTISLYEGSSCRERLRLLLEDWKFRLPMASAILTVFWPEDFTPYDVRVCGQLKKFRHLANLTDFDRVWQDYSAYVIAVREAVGENLSLRDKDRCLWAHSAAEQLENDIRAGFGIRNRRQA